jgi:hypothetical protein
MHVFGHVLIWLIALGALAATVLSAKTYDVRNSWIKKVDQLKQDVAKSEEDVATKEARLSALEDELARTILGWGRPFVNVGGELVGQNFQLNLQDPVLMGWLASLDQATQQSQVIYVFKPQPDGSSIYVGSFQLANQVAAGATGASFVPTWTVRNSDFLPELVQSPTGPFRVRPQVPAHFPSRYADTRGEIAVAERILGDKEADLQEQLLREADAKAIRDRRVEQLQGPDGLVAQLKSAEDARNVELEEVDHWRRKVDQARKEIEDLVNESRKLEQQLDPPASGNPPVTPEVTL